MSNKTKVILEACVETFEQAVAAEASGASRIELCDRLDLGGTTPDLELVERLLSELKIPIMTMVRPRGGDFVFSADEFEQMKQVISMLRGMGCQGVVVGLLTAEGSIDIARTRQLVELARPLQVTFHKAFDECADLSEALHDLKQTGVDRLLTSGGERTALEAVPVLNHLLEEAKGSPKLIVAGKVTHENIDDLQRLIPAAKEFHGKKIVQGI